MRDALMTERSGPACIILRRVKSGRLVKSPFGPSHKPPRFGVPEEIRTPDPTLRRSPRGAFLTPYKSPKILDFTGFSGISLLVNSRPKPANFSWFFAFLLAGY